MIENNFRLIPGFDNKYYINEYGKIISTHNNRIKLLKPFPNDEGYLRICLCNKRMRKTFFVHRLVAQVFLKLPSNKIKYEVNHLDNNRLNNYYKNLEYIDPITHRQKTSRQRKNNYKILSIETVKKIKRLLRNNYSVRSISKKFQIPYRTVHHIKLGTTWNSIKK